MIQFIIMILMIIISILFMNMKHPLAIGLTLITQTFFTCLMTGFMSKTFWFSYMLFIIFIGGMLVLFIYVTSLASNEMFTFSMKLLFLNSFIFFISLFCVFFIDSMLFSSIFMNIDMINNNNMMNFIEENCLNLNKLYNFPNNIITLMMINYLFLTLIIIVKITNNFTGALRSN
uniref:NADH-ubiquinone oxidoreductase chain 6 n=1 Tax=Rhipidia chenwenyoungi TaxID=1807360 RepID=A0A192U6A1_9DIPT|nr:NADH dehydrogenase subunit 6 [Rhipidia chenwenyoungi]